MISESTTLPCDPRHAMWLVAQFVVLVGADWLHSILSPVLDTILDLDLELSVHTCMLDPKLSVTELIGHRGSDCGLLGSSHPDEGLGPQKIVPPSLPTGFGNSVIN